MTTLDDLTTTCADAARRGGAVLRERWGRARTVDKKGTIDLVTDADRASEAAVLGLLSERFPGAAVLAEESGPVRRRGAPLHRRPARRHHQLRPRRCPTSR